MNNQEERKNLEEQIQKMRGNEEHFHMLQGEISKMLRVRYLSLIEAGFTEKQAFTIVVKRGLT
jgi:hypothetical protein